MNAARTKAYVDHGIKPKNAEIKCGGCDGLQDILPCVDSDVPLGQVDYTLPDLDPAPWYDPAAPESKNFAGLMVTSATISAPYSRVVNNRIGQGGTLGRLRLNPRQIIIHGFLIGKTCCAVQYGLRWLTTALGDPPCSGGGCGGCEFDFLDCCPQIGTEEDDCLTTVDAQGNVVMLTRPDSSSEYERAADFFRRMNNVGVVDGPNNIRCIGSNCGCGCAALMEVEFTLAAGSPYLNSFGTDIVTNLSPNCATADECNIVWIKVKDGDTCPDDSCPEPVDCLEDPLCPLPALPPTAGTSITASGCGCEPLRTTRICTTAAPLKEWGSSTLNIEVNSGSTELRNLTIRVFQNPLSVDCSTFDDCLACSTLRINYVPADSTLTLSGETREVTVECNGSIRSGMQNVTNDEGQPFDWPDMSCFPICACIEFDCDNTSPDATVSIVRIDRDL